MIEFKVIENVIPDKDLTLYLKKFKYKVKSGQIKTILHTNSQVIIPTQFISNIQSENHQIFYLLLNPVVETFLFIVSFSFMNDKFFFFSLTSS